MAWVRLGIVVSLLSGIIYMFPSVLSDQNRFLQDFLDNDLLSVLGFVAAVTLGSLGGTYLQVSRVEIALQKDLSAAKAALKLSAGSIVIAFGFSFVLLVVKDLLPVKEVYQAVANASAIVIVYVYLEILWDITFTTFRVGDEIKNLD